MFLAPALAALFAVGAQAANQDSKQDCLDSYVQAQVRQKEGALRAAREALLVCSQPACPAPIPADCGRWLTEVDARLPSVVIAARGPDGNDRTDVTVSLDGKPLVDKLDGKALAVDPGAHVLRYELP